MDVTFPCICIYIHSIHAHVCSYVHMCTLCSLAELLCGGHSELIWWMAQAPHTRLSSYGGIQQQHPAAINPSLRWDLSRGASNGFYDAHAHGVCCARPPNEHRAEPQGLLEIVQFFNKLDAMGPGPHSFYDSTCGIELFRAPMGRTSRARAARLAPRARAQQHYLCCITTPVAAHVQRAHRG